MNNIKIVSLVVGMIVLNGCAPLASIENVASKINAAIPAPNDVGYIAKNSIRTGCTSRMTRTECSQVKNMQMVNKFMYKANYNKPRFHAMAINDVNKKEIRQWLTVYDELQNSATSTYSKEQLDSIVPTMDMIEDKFFPNS